ncbi:hypothetical protein FS842_009073 [Serendipita sp. 407]|nr:hypothetical protein FS842_009073 [Serendipita sp. 407]
MEQEYDDNNKGKSTNMDDSGFFSIQVLENALQVWGLTLIRWRSEEMREYHNSPHTQLGFILNLEQHWFTIRRFGPADPDPSKDKGVGHWFNLNSFLPKPEWVSRTYLGMVLQQAENEGYSVFVVCQIDPLAPLALPRTYADDVAAGITDVNIGKTLPTSRVPHLTSGPSTSSKAVDWVPEGLDEEDPELQAALYASVIGESLESTGSSAPKLAPIETTSDDWNFDNAVSFFGGRGSKAATSAEASVDESARRGREELARFQEEQRQALDLDTEDDDVMIASILNRSGQVPPAEPVATTGRARRGAQDEEEEEMMRRAIEESKMMAEERTKQEEEEDEDEDMGFDDDEVHMHDEDEEQDHVNKLLEARRKRDREREELDRIQRGISPHGASTHTQPQPAFETDPFEADDLGLQDRTYDDEDAMLQAALKASLEGLPADITIPPPPKAPTRAITRQDSSSNAPKAAEVKRPVVIEDEDEDEEEDEEETEEEEEEKPEVPKPLTAEELRKARLARFGG